MHVCMVKTFFYPLATNLSKSSVRVTDVAGSNALMTSSILDPYDKMSL